MMMMMMNDDLLTFALLNIVCLVAAHAFEDCI